MRKNDSCIAIFGGIKIHAPEQVKVRIRSFSLFGGTKDRHQTPDAEDTAMLYIRCFNLFGGASVL